MKAGISLTRQLWVAMAGLCVVTTIVSTAAFYGIYAVLERWGIVAPTPAGVGDTTGLDMGITLGVCLLGLLLALGVAMWLARRIVGRWARSAMPRDRSRRATLPPASRPCPRHKAKPRC
jgi:two-component system sensor histidine kinase AdeS